MPTPALQPLAAAGIISPARGRDLGNILVFWSCEVNCYLWKFRMSPIFSEPCSPYPHYLGSGITCFVEFVNSEIQFWGNKLHA